MKAFYVYGTPSAKRAFDLAYSDIRKAFIYFLKNYSNNRPIIIASHSQGSLHAIRLLQEFFDGKPLQKRLVCAYAVGYQIKKDEYKTQHQIEDLQIFVNKFEKRCYNLRVLFHII